MSADEKFLAVSVWMMYKKGIPELVTASKLLTVSE